MPKIVPKVSYFSQMSMQDLEKVSNSIATTPRSMKKYLPLANKMVVGYIKIISYLHKHNKTPKSLQHDCNENLWLLHLIYSEY